MLLKLLKIFSLIFGLSANENPRNKLSVVKKCLKLVAWYMHQIFILFQALKGYTLSLLK